MVYCTSLFLNILYTVSVSRHCAKITNDFSDDFHFLHEFHLKFTINANIIYIPVEATFSTSIISPDHYGQYI